MKIELNMMLLQRKFKKNTMHLLLLQMRILQFIKLIIKLRLAKQKQHLKQKLNQLKKKFINFMLIKKLLKLKNMKNS